MIASTRLSYWEGKLAGEEIPVYLKDDRRYMGRMLQRPFGRSGSYPNNPVGSG
jgi:hypothetical protein